MKRASQPETIRRPSTDSAVQCIAELRCKALHFKNTGSVFTINSSGISSPHNTAVKADSLVSDELRQDLKAAFEKLRADQGAEPDWHPNSDNQVLDLVHPSMYPFVYGPPALELSCFTALTYCRKIKVHPG